MAEQRINQIRENRKNFVVGMPVNYNIKRFKPRVSLKYKLWSMVDGRPPPLRRAVSIRKILVKLREDRKGRPKVLASVRNSDKRVVIRNFGGRSRAFDKASP